MEILGVRECDAYTKPEAGVAARRSWEAWAARHVAEILLVVQAGGVEVSHTNNVNANERTKLANQLRGPFRVISSLNSTYLLQSLSDSSLTFSIHLSRLRPFLSDDTLPHISPVEVAATDDQESVIDYISNHRGNPTSPSSMTFLTHWLNQDEQAATWQSYVVIEDAVKNIF